MTKNEDIIELKVIFNRNLLNEDDCKKILEIRKYFDSQNCPMTTKEILEICLEVGSIHKVREGIENYLYSIKANKIAKEKTKI